MRNLMTIGVILDAGGEFVETDAIPLDILIPNEIAERNLPIHPDTFWLAIVAVNRVSLLDKPSRR